VFFTKGEDNDEDDDGDDNQFADDA